MPFGTRKCEGAAAGGMMHCSMHRDTICVSGEMWRAGSRAQTIASKQSSSSCRATGHRPATNSSPVGLRTCQQRYVLHSSPRAGPVLTIWHLSARARTLVSKPHASQHCSNANRKPGLPRALKHAELRRAWPHTIPPPQAAVRIHPNHAKPALRASRRQGPHCQHAARLPAASTAGTTAASRPLQAR